MTRALTKHQRAVLDFIVEFLRTRRYSPSLEEIAAHFGRASTATAYGHVRNLERKGYLRRDFNRSRSIEVLPESSAVSAPHCASCRCGLLGSQDALVGVP